MRAARDAALWVASCALLSGCPDESITPVLTLLQANVGNTLLSCQDGYIFKLCEKSVEDAVREHIAALSPEVIALQEILPDGACDAFTEDDPRFVCHPDNTAGDPSQLHRLLGDAYETACDDRNGYECVAVKKGGTLGGYAVLPPVASGPDEECDAGFSVGTIEVQGVAGFAPFTLVNGHPQSGFIGACRDKQLHQIFDAPPSRAVLSGDWNLDPFSAAVDPSIDTWIDNVGSDDENKPFRYHSGVAERRPPYNTTENALFSGVLDHVASDVFAGTCTTLGETPGTVRLDGATGGNGCDHRALFCTLTDPALAAE